MIYLNASALVTFVAGRPHAEQLQEFLTSNPDRTCTSTIGLIQAATDTASPP